MKRTHPDSLLLRVPIFVCLLGLVAGNCVTCFVSSGVVIGRWVAIVSLGLGTILSLLYTGHILFRRLHQRLSDLVALLFIHGLMMVVVAQMYRWLCSFSTMPGATPNGFAWNTLLLALAALSLLFRSSILAIVGANCLPEEWSVPIIVPRKSSIILREELRSPRWYLGAFFWLSPLAWWLFLLLLISFKFLPMRSDIVVGLFVIFAFLQLRFLLAAYVFLNTAYEWWKRQKPVDLQFMREARWYLFSSALPAAGIISFYAFCFAATRVHHDALAAVLGPQVPAHTSALRALHRPPLRDEENALRLYSQANDALPICYDDHLFTYRWNHPDAVNLVHAANQSLDLVRAAAEFDRCQFAPDYGAEIDSFESNMSLRFPYMGKLLMLQARLAAADGDWEIVLQNFRACLSIARHLHQQPFLSTHANADSIEQCAIMTLLPALLRSDFFPPPDDVVEHAQRIIRESQVQRCASLPRVLQSERLWDIRQVDKYYSMVSSAWPGNVELRSFAFDQPFRHWEWREKVVQWHDWLQSKVIDNEYALACVSSRAQFPERSYAGIIMPVDLSQLTSLLSEFEMPSAYRRADSALAAVRFKSKHQRWPANLQECVPDFLPRVPEDPYRPGEFIRFAVNPERIVSAGVKSGSNDNPKGNSNLSDALSDPTENGDVALFLGQDECAASDLEWVNRPNMNVPDEIEFLQSTDADTRRMAMRNLSKVAPHTIEPQLGPRCIRWLESDETEDQMWAAYVLGRMGERANAALEKLEYEASENTDPDVRHFAREAAKKIREATHQAATASN